MNASGTLNPRNDREQWIPIWKGKPATEGAYLVNLIQIGIQKCSYLHGQFYFECGEVVPDSIVIGWK